MVSSRGLSGESPSLRFGSVARRRSPLKDVLAFKALAVSARGPLLPVPGPFRPGASACARPRSRPLSFALHPPAPGRPGGHGRGTAWVWAPLFLFPGARCASFQEYFQGSHWKKNKEEKYLQPRREKSALQCQNSDWVFLCYLAQSRVSLCHLHSFPCLFPLFPWSVLFWDIGHSFVLWLLLLRACRYF